MTWKQIVAGSTLTAVLVVCIGLGILWLARPWLGHGHHMQAWSAGHGWHAADYGPSRWHARAMRRERIGGCAAIAQRWHEHVEHIARGLSLNAEQRQAWSDVTSALEQGRAQLELACAGGMESTASDIQAFLARSEALLTAGLDTLHLVRPAFARFHASLSPDQRRMMDGRAAPGAWH
ncbi:MAG: hypothetical protein FJX35_05455 [Alphaproteobacteria bacterium]|nr:hypothetical protein [Alphaproteobacteria bacterium]